MATWLIWLVVSGIFIIAEVLTLTFYLLLAGAGALVAALFAWLEMSVPAQIIAATLVTIVGWIIVHKYRPQNAHPDPQTNPALNMDIGTVVRLSEITPEKKLLVNLRGARWEARVENDPSPDMTREYVIKRIDGSTLILTPQS